MAVSSKIRSLWPSRLHFLVRFLGLTGLLAAGVGVFLAIMNGLTTISLAQIRADGEVSKQPFVRQYEVIRDTMEGKKNGLAEITAWLVVAGTTAFLIMALVELFVMARTTAGRRSAFGLNMAVQCALAATLFIGLNVYSFEHFSTFDWTRNSQFTLHDDLQNQLRQLQGETVIVVYNRHKSSFTNNQKQDEYDSEAARKVAEKVDDLAAQFRQFGSQFTVEVLDTDEKGYNRKRDELFDKAPELKQALADALENSIFFYVKNKGQTAKIQRLSFNQFYLLDKNASKSAAEGKGNLVLHNQGIGPFARRVLNVDNRKPTVGIAVVHEWLTSRGGVESFSLTGLRKALIEQGFNVEDIVLKKGWDSGSLEPDVATFEEYKYKDLVNVIRDLDDGIKSLESRIKEVTDVQIRLKAASLEDLTKEFAKQLRVKEFTEEIRRDQLAHCDQAIAGYQSIIVDLRQQREDAKKEKDPLSPDSSGEQQRMTDLKSKFSRLLAKCDLLIVPRMTIRDATILDIVPASLHSLDKAQVEAIKDFMKAGKPVLVCFGPANEPPNSRFAMEQKGPDDLETMLTSLGFRFGNQTVLFNEEAKALTPKRSSFLNSRANVQIPPVKFDWISESKPPNPIRSSLLVAEASLGQVLDLSIRSPRPLTFDSEKAKGLDYEPDFMRTTERSWNDDNPFPARGHTPHPEPTKPGDPLYGTPDEKRLGPFTIGVAVEVPIPDSSVTDSSDKPKTVRVAAMGQGHWFVGPELSSAKQRVLLDTCNWLLGRDDELLHEGSEWQYPRVQLSARDQDFWRWGTQLGLPGIFAYLGFVVWMVRRLR
jgi:hypothetical protein